MSRLQGDIGLFPARASTFIPALSLYFSYEVGRPYLFDLNFKNMLHRFFDVVLARVSAHLKGNDPSFTQLLLEGSFFRDMRIAQDVVEATPLCSTSWRLRIARLLISRCRQLSRS